jgi:tRNA(Glu) U13 pseudouridine synthase TruD
MRKFVERPRNASYKFVWYKEPDTTLQHFPPFSVAKAEEIFDTPADGLRKALTIQFDLASGIYATIALRELLRFDLGKTNQKGMSKELRAENEINDLI